MPVRHLRFALICSAALVAILARPPVRFDPATVAENVRVTARDGTLLYESRPYGRAEPGWQSVNPLVVRALIATEDRRFLFHPGVDPVAIVRAAVSNRRSGRVVSGASTLAMQVARMRRGRTVTTWSGKMAEAVLAMRLTMWHGQAAVLHEWLSRAYFGRMAFGIDAAAQAYFGKAASDLTLVEAAHLVGLPQRPSDFPEDVESAAQRRRHVLRAMVRAGYLDGDQAAALSTIPVDPVREPPAPMLAPHLSLALLAQAEDIGTSAVSEIRTTLDADLQRHAEGLARAHVASLAGRNLGNVAAIVLDNASGDVLAYIGSADFLDHASHGANDGIRMLRQPGSALKPFVYAEALERGLITPASILADIETPFVDAGAAFSAQNYDRRYHGPVSARTALANSFNVPAVRLARTVSPSAILSRLEAFGITSLKKPAAHYGVGIALGNGEVSLIELASAYAGLARLGSVPRARMHTWFATARGDTARTAQTEPLPASLSPDTAHLISHMLSDSGARSTAFGRGGPLEFDFPVAAKTGTSKDYRDNWAFGYTPAFTVGVWAGNFDGAPMNNLAGVRGAGTLMHAIMEVLGSAGEFAPPPGVTRRVICQSSGELPGAYCTRTREEVFRASGAPTDTCSVHQLLMVDSETGLRAPSDSPPETAKARIFEVYDEEYRPWLVANDWPLPPPMPAAMEMDAPPRIDAALTVRYPPDGTVFQLDPVLRPEYQVIDLRAGVPGDLFGSHWRVDDTRLETDQVDAARWTLTPGRHRLELWAYDEFGHPVKSRMVSITVLPVTPVEDAL